jgi:hypothetical protein
MGRHQVPRRTSRQPGAEIKLCWVNVPGTKTLRQCSLSDISVRGATVASEGALPDTFDLFLSLDSKEGRRCRVISRAGLEVGVEFLGGR